jgi:hypothetical protein
VELYLGASDENISESYEQTCLPAFTGHLADELRSLPSLTSLQLRYHHAIRATDINALGTLTGLTGLTTLTIQGDQGASMSELEMLYPDELDEGDQLQAACQPVALGELTSLTSLHLHGCSAYIAEELGMECWQGLQWRAPSLAKLTALTSLHLGGGCWEIDDEQMEQISNLTALTYVHLDCYWDSEEPDMRLWELASRLPGLTHLHLPDYAATNDGLRAIATYPHRPLSSSPGRLPCRDERGNAGNHQPHLSHASKPSLLQSSDERWNAGDQQPHRPLSSPPALLPSSDEPRAARHRQPRLPDSPPPSAFPWRDGRGGEDAEQPDGAEIARPDGEPQCITRGDYGAAEAARTGLAHAVLCSK